MSEENNKISLLEKYFFARRDKVCARNVGGIPQPVNAEDKLSDLLHSHVLGDAHPKVRVSFEKKRGHGVMIGRYRLGSYVPNRDGLTPWLCIDFDGKEPPASDKPGNNGKGANPKKSKSGHSSPLADPLEAALKVYHFFYALGFTAYLECSGSATGWHIWIFFDPMIPAIKARKLAKLSIPSDILLLDGTPADYRSCKGIEIFPKQNSISPKGYGNMVWLPWWSGAASPGGNIFHRAIKSETPDAKHGYVIARTASARLET